MSDPTLIREQDIANADGANAERVYASAVFGNQFVGVAQDVAYFTDEWTMDAPLNQEVSDVRPVQLDMRNSALIEAASQNFDDPHLGPLDNAFWQTSIAIPAVRAYTPDSLRGDYLAQLYAIRGFLILQMAEDLCPGFPINDVADNRTVYGGPVSTDSAIAYASGELDSAIKYVRDSARFVTLAHVAKGRALLDQGKYDEAAAIVADVPTNAVYRAEAYSWVNFDGGYCLGCFNSALGDREGTNGEPFASAQDPRIPIQVLGGRQSDTTDTLYIKVPDYSNTVVFASGIEARLIQAEAALHDNQSWKPMLDSLRAMAGLDSLVDPGTPDGRVDVLYRERAFWLFMTGRRLGDLRRLVKNYGRGSETVFPTGTYRGGAGGTYGTATAIPFVFANQQRYNPKITTGCTSR